MHHYAVTLAVTSKRKLSAKKIAKLVDELLNVGYADAASTLDTGMASENAATIVNDLTLSDVQAAKCPDSKDPYAKKT